MLNMRRTRLRWNVAILGVVALLPVIFLGAGMALAHAKFVSSTPADGARTTPGLREIVLTFSEELSLDQSSAQVLTSSGAVLAGVTAQVDKADRMKITVQTPPLESGSYTVKWTAVTEDDNASTFGSFTFSVADVSGSGAGWTLAVAAVAVGLVLGGSIFLMRRRARMV